MSKYMPTLKEMLLKEEERLERIIGTLGGKQEEAPQGSLIIAATAKRAQYYHHMPGENSNGKYIPKSENKFIRELAQKCYDKKVLRLVEKRLGQIKRITKDYEDNEIEKIFLRGNSERQKLVVPVEATWEQQLEAWLSEGYTGKDFRDEKPVILTEKGERVRSKSEKILADYFYKKGIAYKYECPLYLNGFGTVHPDFTFLSPRTREEIYWEHDGRMTDPAYAQQAITKIQAYEENGIFPGERLILTFESDKTVLDTGMIERITARYLQR